ncbi:cytochrome c4 [Pigmentiphaga aceris]|uniref:Cytochrome c4 n=1 Tax=Pigmentiphaga aceris TaxID=1940612 RepID=A0A5C0B5V4_9BURK|nr:c-type cytochrome [Pigmentiphaga aceris]QEI08720.1 cytochrome c4 [Pigmentiphaga aceris]
MKRVLSRLLISSAMMSGAVAGLALGVFASPAFAADAPPSMPKADPAKGEQLFTNGDAARNIVSCASCHGPGGNSAGAANPKLAGQHADYLAKELHNFKSKDGKARPERVSPVMNAQAQPLTEEEIRNISAYLSMQTIKPAFAKNKETVELGQKIYRGGIAAKNVPACAACHSPNGAGLPSQYPRIGGQYPEYTQLQLEHFRSGERNNNPAMTAIAARMSDKEIQAVADYIAGLR